MKVYHLFDRILKSTVCVWGLNDDVEIPEFDTKHGRFVILRLPVSPSFTAESIKDEIDAWDDVRD